VRSARLLEWTDEALHWDILELNAQRAQQCFDSWLAFGQAYAQGRAQWLAQGRSDVLGKAFTSEEVAQWVTQEQHPWHAMSWNLPLTGDEAKPASAPAAQVRDTRKNRGTARQSLFSSAAQAFRQRCCGLP
jgi:hypothetical protein